MGDHQVVPVEREPVRVRYVEGSDSDQQSIAAAWAALESAVGSLKGRKFLAAFDQDAGWYRACVLARQDVTTEEMTLPEMEIPGGGFLLVRLSGEPPLLYDEIRPAYSLLERSAPRDERRPSLEMYRRRDAIDILMPTA